MRSNNNYGESWDNLLARFGIKKSATSLFDNDQDGDVIEGDFSVEIGQGGGGRGSGHGGCAGDAAVNDPRSDVVMAGDHGPPGYEEWDGAEELGSEFDEDGWPGFSFFKDGFFCTEDGVYLLDQKGLTRICGPLQVLHHVELPGKCCRDFKLRTRGGKEELVHIPERALLGNSLEPVRQLADYGLEIVPGRANIVLAYLQESISGRIANGATMPGWQDVDTFGMVYLLPDRTRIMSSALQGAINVVPAASFPATTLTSQSTLGTWQKKVAHPACQINAGILALCAGFAPTLLHFATEEINFLIHFYGKTSKGKSTMLQVAASIWGRHKYEMADWNTTEKGLVDRAKKYRDRPMFLDELGAAGLNPREISKALYSLAGGKGRGRSSAQGNAIGGEQFRTVAISSGEFALHAAMSDENKQPNRGTIHRGLDIEILDAAEDLAEEHRASFMTKLKQATDEAYGTAAKHYLQGLVDQFRQAVSLQEYVYQNVWEIVEGFGLPIEDDAIRRGLERFALLAVAGELAAQQNLIPMRDPKRIRKAIQGYAANWYRIFSPQAVEERLIDRIAGYILRNQTRFQQPNRPVPASRVGWDTLINGEPCFAFTSEGLEAAANERDVIMVAQTLQGAGLLVQNDPAKLKARLGRDKLTDQRPYAYAVKKAIVTYLDEVA